MWSLGRPIHSNPLPTRDQTVGLETSFSLIWPKLSTGHARPSQLQGHVTYCTYILLNVTVWVPVYEEPPSEPKLSVTLPCTEYTLRLLVSTKWCHGVYPDSICVASYRICPPMEREVYQYNRRCLEHRIIMVEASGLYLTGQLYTI